MSDVSAERLADIRSKPFGDLTSAEMADWMTYDPDGYFAAGRAWAREAAERDIAREMRRARERDRDRLLRPFRWLWRLPTGRPRRTAALLEDTEETR